MHRHSLVSFETLTISKEVGRSRRVFILTMSAITKATCSGKWSVESTIGRYKTTTRRAGRLPTGWGRVDGHWAILFDTHKSINQQAFITGQGSGQFVRIDNVLCVVVRCFHLCMHVHVCARLSVHLPQVGKLIHIISKWINGKSFDRTTWVHWVSPLAFTCAAEFIECWFSLRYCKYESV